MKTRILAATVLASLLSHAWADVTTPTASQLEQEQRRIEAVPILAAYLEVHAAADAVVVNTERRVIAANTPRWIVGSRLAEMPRADGEFRDEFQDVAELPLILPSRPNAFRILIEGEMMAIGRRPEIMLEVDGLNAILNLVKEGMGHAVLPSYTLSNFDNPETFTVQSIHSPRIMSQLMLVWSARRPTTQTQRKAMDVVSKVVLEAIHR